MVRVQYATILQSNDLCRVVASHRRVMQKPQEELDRIYTQLREGCGLPVPHKVSPQDVTSFIDIKLQHGRTTLVDTTCEHDHSNLMPPETWPTTDPEHVALYREVMRVYCAMENGSAFLPSFKWQLDMKDN